MEERCTEKKNTKMESSVGEKYPNPSPICALNFITFNSKLSGRDNYGLWKIQMLVCLLDSHQINGKPVTPQTRFTVKRSDALVKVWILGSLSERTGKFSSFLFHKLPKLPTFIHTKNIQNNVYCKCNS